MKRILILTLFICNLTAQELNPKSDTIGIFNLYTPPQLGVNYNSSALNLGDCDKLVLSFPENFQEHFLDLDLINHHLLPRTDDFMALRLTQISQDEILIHTGRFQFQDDGEDIKLIPFKDPNPHQEGFSEEELDQLMQTPAGEFLAQNRRIIRTMFLNEEFPQAQPPLNFNPNLVPLSPNEKKVDMPELDLSWKLKGRSRISLDGGVINLGKTTFIEKAIDRQIAEIEMESYQAGARVPGSDPHLNLLRENKERFQFNRAMTQFIQGRIIDDQTPYISVIITFP